MQIDAPNEPSQSVIPLPDALGAPVGGKAEGLSRLIAAGLRVPKGFVMVRRTDNGDLASAYDALGGGAVAVRSSAVGEDSAEASFAGQYETVLEVEGIEALEQAVQRCLASTSSDRAVSYRERSSGTAEAVMNVVVQQMVAPRAAGVLFTADPVTGRRDCVVADAVAGTGEALVSGQVSPDHYRLLRTGELIDADLQQREPLLDQAALRELVSDALRAEESFGHPLDLEWAIDRQGTLYWLQARPITALARDPDELGTLQDEADHYTSCNIGECMPGPVTPLSFSTVWRGNDSSLQVMQSRMGIQREPNEGYRFSRLYYGRILLNLTKLGRSATHVAGSTTEQLALAICGRVIPELDPGPKASTLTRAINGARYVTYLASGKRHQRKLERLVDELTFPAERTSAAMYEAIDSRLWAIMNAFDHHMTSSAGSGALEPTLMGILSQGKEPGPEEHAQVAALLASVSEHDVESADIAAGIDRIGEAALRHPGAAERLLARDDQEVLAWLRSAEAAEVGREFERYLRRHGHRCVREFELREREWASDPGPLLASLRASLTARQGRGQTPRPGPAAAVEVPARLRPLIRLTQSAVRRRERTKSLLVRVITRFKRAYRRLGDLVVDEGVLPDADLLFFLGHEEIGALIRGESDGLVEAALGRREALDYQERITLPDVFTGSPAPLDTPPPVSDGGRQLSGKPVSRGRVEGVARVARDLAEAAALKPGEILIAPITDVGWSPYFGVIAGLATDVGSSVSHGAVVAREYHLPAVVDLRRATQVFRTGDRVILDGDRGTLERADDEKERADAD